MAGAAGQGANNQSFYLYTGNSYWTMSPGNVTYSGASEFAQFASFGGLTGIKVDTSYGLRPVISLKYGIKFEKGGDGTPTNPYVVKYE